jgi:hypothetical protein
MPVDRRFRSKGQKITPVARFIPKHKVPFSQGKVNLLKQMTVELKRQGITLVLILAPVSQAPLEGARSREGFKYIEELRERLVDEIPNAFDFFELKDLNVSDCEFSDSLHAGEVAHMRIIQEIAKRSDSPLKHYVNVDALGELISNNVDGVTIADDDIGKAFRSAIDQQFQACQKTMH